MEPKMNHQPENIDNSPLEPALSPEVAARYTRYLIIGVVMLVLVGMGAFAYIRLNAPPEVSEARLNQEAFLGSADAPVLIIEYGAYGCTTCRGVHRSEIFQELMAEYDIQLIFRNYPVIHRNDQLSAQAAQCALDQGEEAFWTLHNAIYELSNQEYWGYSDPEDYVALAEAHRLDGEALQACLDNRTHERTVQHWKEEGDNLNLPGTPTLYVNGQRVNNVALLEDIIREELGLG